MDTFPIELTILLLNGCLGIYSKHLFIFAVVTSHFLSGSFKALISHWQKENKYSASCSIFTK